MNSTEVKLILKKLDLRPKKHLGQNFLINENLLKKIILLSEISKDDIILEILDISDVNNMTAALMLQICSTPSFVVDDVPIFIGEVPSVEVLNATIDNYKNTLKM